MREILPVPVHASRRNFKVVPFLKVILAFATVFVSVVPLFLPATVPTEELVPQSDPLVGREKLKDVSERSYPRVVACPTIYKSVIRKRLPKKRRRLQKSKAPRQHRPSSIPPPLFDKKCTPMKPWQTASYPTCNILHELDFNGQSTELMGVGGERIVWKVDGLGTDIKKAAVLKMFQWKNNFFVPYQFETQRVDAVIAERLTSSPHSIDIYGFCGLSSLGEVGQKDHHWIRRAQKLPPGEKLSLGRDLAVALADLHDSDRDGNITAVYRNLKPENVMFVDGVLKINDFDDSILMRWDASSRSPCKFHLETFAPRKRMYQPAELSIYGSPLTEKIDIYSLGAVLFSILSGERPYSTYGSNNAEKARLLKNGILPQLPSEVTSRNDTATLAMTTAFHKCMAHDPELRPTARAVAANLDVAFRSLHGNDR